MKERVQFTVHNSQFNAEPEGKMGKNVVSKRSKGKVDFKRKADPARRPVEDEDDKTEVYDDAKNNENEIEIIMKKCKVIINSCENIKNHVILSSLRYLATKPLRPTKDS